MLKIPKQRPPMYMIPERVVLHHRVCSVKPPTQSLVPNNIDYEGKVQVHHTFTHYTSRVGVASVIITINWT